jgi:hypothetical protein
MCGGFMLQYYNHKTPKTKSGLFYLVSEPNCKGDGETQPRTTSGGGQIVLFQLQGAGVELSLHGVPPAICTFHAAHM